MNSELYDFLKTVYIECNAHERDQVQKRDRIISIYMIVYALI